MSERRKRRQICECPRNAREIERRFIPLQQQWCHLYESTYSQRVLRFSVQRATSLGNYARIHPHRSFGTDFAGPVVLDLGTDCCSPLAAANNARVQLPATGTNKRRTADSPECLGCVHEAHAPRNAFAELFSTVFTCIACQAPLRWTFSCS